jgi:hypothetical protein
MKKEEFAEQLRERVRRLSPAIGQLLGVDISEYIDEASDEELIDTIRRDFDRALLFDEEDFEVALEEGESAEEVFETAINLHRAKKSKDPLEEELEKVFIFADATLFRIMNSKLSEKERKEHIQHFLTAHQYFIALTVEALENRELAEVLAPLFDKLEGLEPAAYTDCMGILSDVLRLKHGIPRDGPLPTPEEVKDIHEKASSLAPFLTSRYKGFGSFDPPL